tara:strand:- start:961 stop:1107 length:147 start_codon:yes stop_codon:yes gene_type:complete
MHRHGALGITSRRRVRDGVSRERRGAFGGEGAGHQVPDQAVTGRLKGV